MRNNILITVTSPLLPDLDDFSAELKEYLLRNQQIAKLLFRTDRSKVLGTILEKISFPLIYDTTIHLLNHICVKDVGLAVMEDAYLKEELDNSFGEIC